MNRKIILVIRRTQDYYLYGKVMSYMREYQYAWNMFFNLQYIEFRKRLSEISVMSYMYAGFDKIYFWQNDKIYRDINKRGHIVLSIDEDDWINRSIVQELRKFDFQDMSVAMWRVIHLRCKPDPLIYYAKLKETPSCGYAIKALYDMRLSQRSYRMHYSSTRKDYIKLDKILAIKLDNYSSISFAEHHPIVDLLELMKKKYLVTPNEDLQEYSDQVKAYNNLLLDLYDSCKV